MPASLLERLAPARPRKTKLVDRFERQRGARLAPGELRRWLALWQARAVDALDLGQLELVAPSGGDRLTELVRAPERLVAFLAGGAIVGRRAESRLLAACQPADDGASRVYVLDEGDRSRGPALVAPSIAAWLFDALLAADGGSLAPRVGGVDRLQPYLKARRAYQRATARLAPSPVDDPTWLHARSAWLVDWLCDALDEGRGELWPEGLSRVVSAAGGPLAAFVAERELLAARPDLALYWIWAHALLGRRGAVAEVAAALADAPGNPAVNEALALARKIDRGQATPRLAVAVAELRRLIPPPTGRPPAAARMPSAGRQPTGERSAMRALKRAAKSDPRVEEALRLLAEFDAGKHLEGLVDWRMLMPQRRFAELIDERFAPLLIGRIHRGARHADDEPGAIRGVIYGWGKVAGGFAAFQAVIDEAGTARLGSARLEELYRTWGELADDDEGAAARLTEAARRFVADPADPLHREAFRRLLGRQGPEVEALILRYLEGVDPTDEGADRMLCIEAVFAAARLKLAAAAEAIQRLVGGGLGTLTEEERVYRGRLLRALFHTSGGAGYVFVRGLYARYVAASGGEKLEPLTEPWSEHNHELACLVATMHMMRPDDEWARSLFLDAWRRYALLTATVSQIDYVGMIALLRAVEEAGLDGYEGMLLAFAEHRVEPKHAHQQRWASSVREIAAHLCRITPGCPVPTCRR